jgi:hypothetical protein
MADFKLAGIVSAVGFGLGYLLSGRASQVMEAVQGEYGITYMEAHNDAKNQHKYYLLLTSGRDNYTAYGRLPGYGRDATMKLDKQPSASKMKELAMKKMKTYQLVGHKYDQIPSEIRAKLETAIGVKPSSPPAESKPQKEEEPKKPMDARLAMAMKRRQMMGAEGTLYTAGKWRRPVKFRHLDDKKYDGAIELQGYGFSPAKLGENLQIGDVLVWNNGYKSRILDIQPKGKQSLVLKTMTQDTRYKKGEEFERTIRKNRLVGVAQDFHKFNGVMIGDLPPVAGQPQPQNARLAMAMKRRQMMGAEGLNFSTNCLNCGNQYQVMDKKDHVKLVCYDCSDYIKLPKSHLSDSNKRELIMIQEGFKENEKNEAFRKKYPHGMMASEKFEADMSVGNEMLRQLGGRRFMMMVGAKQPIWDGDKNELHMKIGRNALGANYFIIRLNPRDLYDLRFESRRMNRKTYEMSVKVKAEYDDVYADQLQDIFEKATGLYTRMAESFEAEGVLCSDCPMAGRHVVIRKDHTDEEGNLICPFCHSNKNFKNIPETTYLLHGGRREDLRAEGGMSFDEKIKHLASHYGVGGLHIKRNYRKGQKLGEMMDDLGIPRGMVQEGRIKDEAIHQNKYKYLGVAAWDSNEKMVKAVIEQLRKEGKIISTRCAVCKDPFPPMFLFKKIAPKTGEEITVCKGCKGFFGAEYQPDQEIGDYSVAEIAKSSAIEGYQPNKYSFGPISLGAESKSCKCGNEFEYFGNVSCDNCLKDYCKDCFNKEYDKKTDKFVCSECVNGIKYGAETFEAPQVTKPFYIAEHEENHTHVMHPSDCGHYKMMDANNSKWYFWGDFDSIEEMVTEFLGLLANTQADGMPDDVLDGYKNIKTVGDARKWLKNHYGFKLNFAPCFRKLPDWNSKAYNGLPITPDLSYVVEELDAESISDLKLKKDSCCCGATKKHPCLCMIKGTKQCSAKSPMCPCYKEIAMGTKVEMEHTKSKEEAEKIAKEHLAEHPDYYSRLKKAGLNAESTDSIPKPNPVDKEETFAWVKREHPHIKTEADKEMDEYNYAALTYHPEELESGAVNALRAGDLEAAQNFVKAINRQKFIKAFQAERNR